MTEPDERRAAANRREQAALYGAPLADIFDEITTTYAVSRRRLAAVLGLSAPMVSQLASGNRLKIGNPRAVQRLQHLLQELADVRAGLIAADSVLAAVAAEDGSEMLTRSTVRMRTSAIDVRHVLRWAGGPDELADAADALEGRFPRLAEVVRVYGVGPVPEATDHFRRILPE